MDKIIRNPESFKVFWLKAIQAFIDQENALYYFEVPPESWAEIDFHPEFNLIKNHIAKYIHKQDFLNFVNENNAVREQKDSGDYPRPRPSDKNPETDKSSS